MTITEIVKICKRFEGPDITGMNDSNRIKQDDVLIPLYGTVIAY
jgi:hypothetical protein